MGELDLEKLRNQTAKPPKPLDFGIDIEKIPERESFFDYLPEEKEALLEEYRHPKIHNISPELKKKIERFVKLNNDLLGGGDQPWGKN
ncbi:MAG: hypothetical protein WC847_03015 [Candidatus Paceibacterota bacterium]|jgi:hypothetical protein